MAATAQIEADVYVDKARKLMDAVRSAEAEYLTLLSPLHPSQVHTSSSAGADKSTKSDTATAKKAQKVTATITPNHSSSSSASPSSNSSYCELMQTILGQKRSVQAI